MYCLVGGLRQALARSGVVLSKGGLKTNTYYKPEHTHMAHSSEDCKEEGEEGEDDIGRRTRDGWRGTEDGG